MTLPVFSLVSLFIRNPQCANFIRLFFILASAFFVFAFNGKRSVRLSVIAIILALLYAYCMVWSNQSYFSLFSLILLPITAYAANSFLQVYHQNNNLKVVYSELFDSVWNNFTRLLCALLFVFAFVILLMISAALFAAIGATIISDALTSSGFLWFIIPIMTFVGLYISYRLEKIFSSLRYGLLTFCQILQPIITVVGIVYLLSWIVMSVLPGGMKSHGAELSVVLPFFILAGIIIINSLYQDGSDKHGLSAWQKKSTLLLIVLLLIFSVQSLRAFLLYFSIKSGISNLYLAALIANILLLLYSITYCISIFGRDRWLAKLGKFNIVIGWFAIVIVMVGAFPFWQTMGLVKKSLAYSYNPKPMPHYTLQQAGLAWKNYPAKNAVIVGYAYDKPLYACRVSIDGETIPGQLTNKQCVVTVNKKIYQPKKFDVLTGDGKTSWFEYYYANKKFAVQADQRKNIKTPFYVCRGIYNNRIVIGTSLKYMPCYSVVDGKVVTVEQANNLFTQVK